LNQNGACGGVGGSFSAQPVGRDRGIELNAAAANPANPPTMADTNLVELLRRPISDDICNDIPILETWFDKKTIKFF